jgi:hypothetical protein
MCKTMNETSASLITRLSNAAFKTEFAQLNALHTLLKAANPALGSEIT